MGGLFSNKTLLALAKGTLLFGLSLRKAFNISALLSLRSYKFAAPMADGIGTPGTIVNFSPHNCLT